MTNCMIIIGIYLSVMSIVLSYIFSKSNDKQSYIDINKVCCTYFVILIFNFIIIPLIFKIDYSLNVFPKILIPNIIAVFIYLTTITDSQKKIYDANTSETPQKGRISRFASIIIAIPLLIYSFVIVREYYYIYNSDILIVYCYEYNDHTIFGKEDSGWYACAISDSYCKKVDFGSISTIKLLMSQKMTRVSDDETEDSWTGEYTIYSYGSDDFIVYKNGKEIGSFSDFDPWLGDREKYYGYCKHIYIRRSD